MRYSDELEQITARHRNARHIGLTATIDPAITLARASPLNWAALNGQHAIHRDALDIPSYAQARTYLAGQRDSNYHSWNLMLDNLL